MSSLSHDRELEKFLTHGAPLACFARWSSAINENVAQYRRDLVSKASKMKKDDMIFSFWTLDGNVCLTTFPQGRPVRIYDTSNLENL